MKIGKYREGPASCVLEVNRVVRPDLRDKLREVLCVQCPPEFRRTGYATALLWRIVREADASATTLMLKAAPYGDDAPMDCDSLALWYARFGFRPLTGSPGVMVRMPGWKAEFPCEPSPVAAAAGALVHGDTQAESKPH